MITFENQVIINKPIGEVFQYLSDFRNIPKWNYAMNEVRPVLNKPDIQIGDRYRYSREFLGNTENGTLFLHTYQQNEYIRIKSQDAPHPFSIIYKLDISTINQTVITNRIELSPRGILHFVAPFLRKRMKSAVAQNLYTLKAVLEQT